MNKTVLLAAAAVLAISAGSASAATAHPGMSTKGMNIHATRFNPPSNGAAVLYSQNSNDSGIGIVSQNFESTFAQYDAQAADDFVVPKGSTWKVSEVDATGVYFNGSGLATSEDVSFYKAKKGLPGKQVGSTVTATGKDNGTGSFAIKLKKGAASLKSGTYFVSVVANLAFSAGGEWGWENQTTAEGNPAAWQNPGGGFAVGCTTWGVENVCIPDGQGDHMFVLKGKSS